LTLEDGTDRLTRNVGNYQQTLHKSHNSEDLNYTAAEASDLASDTLVLTFWNAEGENMSALMGVADSACVVAITNIHL
jgi:hypothetical protein